MPRIVIVGLACSTFLILLSSSAVPQETRAGSRRRLGAIDIQQRMPNLPYDQGRRQSLGSQLTQHYRKESRLVGDLRLFQRYEGRGFRVEQGEARRLHRETR